MIKSHRQNRAHRRWTITHSLSNLATMTLFSLDTLDSVLQAVLAWLSAHGLKILLILVGAWMVHRFIHRILEALIRRLIVPGRFPSPEAERKTEDTLIRVFHGAIVVVLWALAGMMVLSEVGVDISPLIAGAGIAGLAFGFGGQYLIRDIISGLFIILENQYRVGDVVCIGDRCGLVEDLTLRMTILRDIEGTVHYIPNGEIKMASNLGKDFARVKLEVGIAYDSDLEQVIQVVNQVGEELAQDAEWKDKIIKAPSFNRVEDFADSAIIIRILGETKPLEQWAVKGELRKRLKIAFDKAGIEIPFPQRVIHQAKQ